MTKGIFPVENSGGETGQRLNERFTTVEHISSSSATCVRIIQGARACPLISLAITDKALRSARNIRQRTCTASRSAAVDKEVV